VIIYSYCFKSVFYVCVLTNQYFFHLLVNLCYQILCGYHIYFNTLIKLGDNELEESSTLWNAPVLECLQLLTLLRLRHLLIAFALRGNIRFFKASSENFNSKLIGTTLQPIVLVARATYRTADSCVLLREGAWN